jgi:hypothetical protein
VAVHDIAHCHVVADGEAGKAGNAGRVTVDAGAAIQPKPVDGDARELGEVLDEALGDDIWGRGGGEG